MLAVPSMRMLLPARATNRRMAALTVALVVSRSAWVISTRSLDLPQPPASAAKRRIGRSSCGCFISLIRAWIARSLDVGSASPIRALYSPIGAPGPHIHAAANSRRHNADCNLLYRRFVIGSLLGGCDRGGEPRAKALG